MRYHDFCKKLLEAYKLSKSSIPCSGDTTYLALRDAGFTTEEAEKLVIPVYIRGTYDPESEIPQIVFETLYVSITPWWRRWCHSVQDLLDQDSQYLDEPVGLRNRD